MPDIGRFPRTERKTLKTKRASLHEEVPSQHASYLCPVQKSSRRRGGGEMRRGRKIPIKSCIKLIILLICSPLGERGSTSLLVIVTLSI